MISFGIVFLIEDGASGAAGGQTVKDAAGAAERGAGEPKCAAFWGDRASLTG